LITRMKSWYGIPVDEQRRCLFRGTPQGRPSATSPLYGSDRGFFSGGGRPDVVKQQGVKVVCIPQRGGAKRPSAKPMRRASFKTASAFAHSSRAHLGCCFRSRHEALPRRSRERFDVGRAAGSRQQPHEDGSPVGVTDHRAAKSRLTLPILRSWERDRRRSLRPRARQRGSSEIAQKSRITLGETNKNTSIVVVPNFIGTYACHPNPGVSRQRKLASPPKFLDGKPPHRCRTCSSALHI